MTTNYEQPAGEVTNYATSSLQQFGKDMLRYEGDKTPKTSDDAMQLKLQQSSKVENGRLVY
jgi:hypothetical protein